MLTKRRRQFVPGFVLSLLFVASCASSDGGSSGTGLTTARGNVTAVRSAGLHRPLPGREPRLLAELRDLLRLESPVNAGSNLGGIHVSIEGTQVAGRTDTDGTFDIRGDFGGRVGLRFQRPEDGIDARLVVPVPRGGTISLSNVRIDGSGGTAAADKEGIQFRGILSQTDCTNGLAIVVSELSPNDGNRFTVHLNGAMLRDRRGQAITCPDLRGGDVIDVNGDVRSDGDYDASSVDDSSEEQTTGNGGGAG